MYKTLIADDEEIIRKGLVRLLSNDPQIELVAQAEDGEMALRLAREQLPDLLLVDINMPFLNGLEFIEKLGDLLSGAVIIIISGYDDFGYAQKAIRLGAFDYLLKPIMEDTLFTAVEKAKRELGRNRKKVKYLEWARMQVDKNRPMFIADLLENWLSGSLSELEILEQAEHLNLTLPQSFGLTVARLTLQEKYSTVGREWDENLLYYAAENIAREVLEPFAPIATSKNSYGDLIVISAHEPDEAYAQAGQSLAQLLEEHLPVDIVLAQQQTAQAGQLWEIYEAIIEDLESNRLCTPLILQVRGYIEQHYGDVELSLQTVALHHHLSPQHLSRLFRQETGVTFVDYITKVRTRKAVQLLMEGELKIYEIAEQVGYSSQHYFSRAFKRVLGVSPVEYRTCKQK